MLTLCSPWMASAFLSIRSIGRGQAMRQSPGRPGHHKRGDRGRSSRKGSHGEAHLHRGVEPQRQVPRGEHQVHAGNAVDPPAHRQRLPPGGNHRAISCSIHCRPLTHSAIIYHQLDMHRGQDHPLRRRHPGAHWRPVRRCHRAAHRGLGGGALLGPQARRRDGFQQHGRRLQQRRRRGCQQERHRRRQHAGE